MSAPITFGGLASGLDTGSIISKLVSIEEQPMTALQQQIANETTQQGLVQNINTQVQGLSTALEAISTSDTVQGRAVNVDTGAPFTAATSGGAPLGSYNIVVNQLAQAQRTYSNPVAGADQAGAFNPGTVTISMGGTSAKINVTASDTLNTLASKLNSTGLNLSASVVYDGSNYRLVVNSLDTGSQNAMVFSDPSNTGLGLSTAANTAVQAQDAMISVDGLSVQSAQNTVTGIIPGVTLTLNALSATGADGVSRVPSSMSISNDPSQLESALQAIVTAYNTVSASVAKQFPQAGQTTALGANTLVGDSTIGELQNSLLGLTTQSGGPPGNAYTTLTDLGVTVDSNGTMSLDTDTLSNALAQNPTAVTNLLVGTNGTNGLVSTLNATLNTYTDFVSGLLPSESNQITQTISQQNTEIAQMQAMATAYQQNLTQEFSNMEQIISNFNTQTSALNAINNSNSSTSSTSSSTSTTDSLGTASTGSTSSTGG